VDQLLTGHNGGWQEETAVEIAAVDAE
jgi:hypothetical protein